MIVDLHSHSTASDGSDPPRKVVELAVESGLSCLALTDHDTQEGLEEAALAASGSGLELIPGRELSLDFDRGGMHLIVLWLRPGAAPLGDRLGALRAGRDERNLRIVETLTKIGLPMTIAEVGVNRFTQPDADWYAVTTIARLTPAKSASGARMGIASVA